MRPFVVCLLLLGGLAEASRPVRPRFGKAATPCVPCRATDYYLNPMTSSPHTALRFVSGGQLYTPPGPFATYRKRAYYRVAGENDRQEEELRFGAIYLSEDVRPPEGRYSRARSVVCVRGRDTMQVFVFAPTRSASWLYDSIPFRPGRYELEAGAVNLSVAYPARPGQQPDSTGLSAASFAGYYQQHRADLNRDNPFAGCRLHGTPRSMYALPLIGYDGYAPTQATEIFNLLLAHTTYLKVKHWRLRPLLRYERVLPTD